MLFHPQSPVRPVPLAELVPGEGLSVSLTERYCLAEVPACQHIQNFSHKLGRDGHHTVRELEGC